VEGFSGEEAGTGSFDLREDNSGPDLDLEVMWHNSQDPAGSGAGIQHLLFSHHGLALLITLIP
jgi:hypothetical protein